MLTSQGRFGPNFVPELDAVAIGRAAGLPTVPVMIYGEDVTHVVTEQGIAYLYLAADDREKTKLMGAVAQGIEIGDQVTPSEIEAFRKAGKVAWPEDLAIDPAKATPDLLAARSLEELVDWSGGLYEIPEPFRQ